MRRALILGFVMVIGLAVLTAWSSSGFANEGANYNCYLINALQDKNLGIRTSAAQLLGERKCGDAIEPLKKMMKEDKFYAARIIAAMALKEIGDESVIPEIKKTAMKDRNHTVRHVLVGIVYEMQTQYLAKI